MRESCWRLRMKAEKVLKAKINAKGMQISVVSDGSYDDYISLTDIAKYKSEDPAATRAGSNAFTLSPKRWLEAAAAIGMYSKSGRNGEKQIQIWMEIFETMLHFSSSLYYLILKA